MHSTRYDCASTGGEPLSGGHTILLAMTSRIHWRNFPMIPLLLKARSQIYGARDVRVNQGERRAPHTLRNGKDTPTLLASLVRPSTVRRDGLPLLPPAANKSLESSDAAINSCLDDNWNRPMPKLCASAVKDTWRLSPHERRSAIAATFWSEGTFHGIGHTTLARSRKRRNHAVSACSWLVKLVTCVPCRIAESPRRQTCPSTSACSLRCFLTALASSALRALQSGIPVPPTLTRGARSRPVWCMMSAQAALSWLDPFGLPFGAMEAAESCAKADPTPRLADTVNGSSVGNILPTHLQRKSERMCANASQWAIKKITVHSKCERQDPIPQFNALPVLPTAVIRMSGKRLEQGLRASLKKNRMPGDLMWPKSEMLLNEKKVSVQGIQCVTKGILRFGGVRLQRQQGVGARWQKTVHK